MWASFIKFAYIHLVNRDDRGKTDKTDECKLHIIISEENFYYFWDNTLNKKLKIHALVKELMGVSWISIGI